MRCEESVANKQVESVTIQLSCDLECAGTLLANFLLKVVDLIVPNLETLKMRLVRLDLH